MSEIQTDQPALSISVSSDVDDDRWHDQKGPKAFESWRFDALSDDGRQALMVTFHDNYPYSPRYFNPDASRNGLGHGTPDRFPAVSLVYSVDGKIVLGAVNEFRSGDFSPNRNGVNCSIGPSWFRVDAAEYGTGYLLRIDLLTARKRRILAELEWLSIEAGLRKALVPTGASDASWNIVAPRSDVSGRITLTGRTGKTEKTAHFRGTGFHDHFRSEGAIDRKLTSRYWGRAHFADHTAVFQCLTGKHTENSSKLLMIRNGNFDEKDAETETISFVRNRFGLKVPNAVHFAAPDDVRLRVNPIRVIQSGFSEVKMVSEMSLTLGEEKPRQTTGITTFLVPGRLKRRLISRLSDLRIGKNGKSPLF